jgi:hypothetical protein
MAPRRPHKSAYDPKCTVNVKRQCQAPTRPLAQIHDQIIPGCWVEENDPPTTNIEVVNIQFWGHLTLQPRGRVQLRWMPVSHQSLAGG